jgi:ribonuclease-3
LEFLGDAVLELIVTEDLFEKYPDKPEGEMTKWRAALVNAKMLSTVANEIELNEFLILSQGEKRETGKARQYILADAIEAFIGAMYLDQGYSACQKFIKDYIMVKLPHIIEAGLYRDAKSSFQEKAQEKVSITPNYKVVKATGPDHQKRFTIGVYLGKELIAKGNGSSKQEAEEDAAKNAIEIKGWE